MAISEQIARAIHSCRLAYGEDCVTRDLEERFAEYHGRRFAIAANSGTSALLMGFYACRVGDPFSAKREAPAEVVVPAYGFFATASPLLLLGARPIFCDVDRVTGNLDPVKAEERITERTLGIAVTHVAGHPAPMDEICGLAARHGLFVLEDCSHAHGSRLRGRLVGGFGDVAALSLQSSKIVTAGEGGVMLTDGEDELCRAASLGNFRRLEGTTMRLPAHLADTGLGLKLRMGPLGAAMALHFLSTLDLLCGMREERLYVLSQEISAEVGDVFETPQLREDVTRGAWYEYHLRLRTEDAGPKLARMVRAALEAEGLCLPKSNTRPLYDLPLFGCLERNFPVAERLGWSTIALPVFTTEPLATVREYAAAVIKVGRQIDRLRSQRYDAPCSASLPKRPDGWSGHSLSDY